MQLSKDSNVATPVGLNVSQKNRLKYASYILPEAQLIYVETPKSACSSFKHTIAAISGFNCADTFSSNLAAKTRALAIHDRSLVKILSLADLSKNELEEITHDSKYIRFCVVRNPYLRLASAWSDRLLCHSLSPRSSILSGYSFPEYKSNIDYLKYEFTEFVNYLYEKEYPHFSNHHWQSLGTLLHPDIVNYNLVIKLEKLNDELPVIIRHVESKGMVWPGLPRINETAVKVGSSLYTPVTRKKVFKMYQSDFDRYDYSHELDLTSSGDITLPDVNFVKAIQERNQRIFHLSLKVRNMI